MSQLTSQERHRVFQIRQEATRQPPAPASVVSGEPPAPWAPRRGWRRLVEIVTIVVLLGGGVLAYHAVGFHRPASIVEALLPRL
jgi:hypothetical protein